MSGALAGPAVPLAAGAGTIRLSRLWCAVGVAVAMHAALLAIRPGGVAGSHVAPAARAMAVRMLRPPAAAEPLADGSAREPAPIEPAAAAAPTPVAAAVVPQPAAAAIVHSPSPARMPAARTERDARSQRAEPTSRAHEPDPAAARAPAAAMPSTAETALPAAPDYAFGVRLDPGPRPLDDIDPAYPDVYLREGTVVLRLLISETGHVDNVAVVRAEPHGVFEQAALDAFGKARFAPGLAAGTPVKSQITVEVRFVPINRGARVSGRTY